MQKDGLGQLVVSSSLSHHLWQLREDLEQLREGRKASFLAEALFQLPQSQHTAVSKPSASSKRGQSPGREASRVSVQGRSQNAR